MTNEDYLAAVLASQRFDDDDPELKVLRDARDAVEKLLRKEYGSGPSIRYGGSHAKGTMIKASYDLDILCYFTRDDKTAGETLKDIHASVKMALEKEYFVEEKRSALRLKSRDKKHDFHIDVVPGRYVDDNKKGDVFLYQADGDKNHLKTNPDKHIEHVKESGHTDVIALIKYWVFLYNVNVKTFVLELATISALDGAKATSLEGRLKHVLADFAESIRSLTVEDPANPTGNDLSAIWTASVKAQLTDTATQALKTVENDGWSAVFKVSVDAALAAPPAVATLSVPLSKEMKMTNKPVGNPPGPPSSTPGRPEGIPPGPPKGVPPGPPHGEPPGPPDPPRPPPRKVG